MADPISLVGTAVGVISLGVQVCQGLYSYVESVQSRRKDLEVASYEIRHLIQAFQSLESLIPRLEALPSLDVTTIDTLHSCITQEYERIKDLHEVLESFQDLPQQDGKGKLKNAGRALKFGIRRDDLSKMQGKVNSLITTTELSLQVINLQLGLSHTAESAKLSTAIQPQLSAVKQSLSHLQQQAGKSGALLQNLESQIKTTSTNILAAVDSTTRDVRSANTHLASQNQVNFQALQVLLTTQHQQTQNQLTAMQTAHATELSQLHLRLIEKPPALREVCDILNNSHAETPTRRHSHRSTSLISVCSCGMRNRGIKLVDSTLQLGTFRVYAQQRETSRHSKDCAFRLPQKHTSIGIRFELPLRQIVSYLVNMSLSYTAGASGFSISPKLNAVRVVKHSPAFDLIDRLFYPILTHSSLRPPEHYHEQVTKAGTQILALFQSGQASPHDKDASGKTILHHIAYHCAAGWDCANALMQERITYHILRLLRTLISAGVPVGETSQSGWSMLDILAAGSRAPRWSSAAQSSIWTVAAEISQLIETEPFNFLTFPITRLVINNEALIHELDLTPLITAILLKSETDVRTILDNSSTRIFERYCGLTVLQLSSSWPIGLSLLISAGASTLIDEVPGHTYSALELALNFCCEEAVQILLDHGAIWDIFQANRVCGTSLECYRRLAANLVERRTMVYTIAKQTLAADDLSQLRILDGGFPDADTLFITQKLQTESVKIPKSLTVPEYYEGVYLCGSLDIGRFPIFFDSGFSNIHERNIQGLLPLNIARIGTYLCLGYGDMHVSFICPDVLSWLLQHSCLHQCVSDPLSLGFNTSATGFHFLTLRLLKESNFESLQSRPETSEFVYFLNRFFETVLGTRNKDNCNCWCSTGGCLPLNTYLKTLAEHTDKELDLLTTEYVSLDPDCSIIDWNILTDLATELIRFLTFEALEMTHTCCIADKVPVMNTRESCQMLMRFPGNVTEIQDEEKELGERLEMLTENFRSQLAESQEPIFEFVFGPWRERMASECIPSFEESPGITQIGVRLSKTYETPISLQNILGWKFDFLTSDEEPDDEQSESESQK
ncbi:hypothetical protein EDB81DRAFT_808661 [Dactylonectria macrodidyma]|uniref:Fungal N-terminal domain-containing protein n=1 Tax=Dactylonectria macrodidyma TaxID=307937 RepID=A0A9P9E1K0_9HYPO|nr:hypothetical protein EDB81DRAFT_808661 [Dactylonectria macrodidyma]